LSKRSLPFAVLFISVFSLCGPQLQRCITKFCIEKTGSALSFHRQKFPNLDLKTISADTLPYLRKYSLPAADGAAFCRYLERIQHDHEVKVEEGLLDMMAIIS